MKTKKLNEEIINTIPNVSGCTNFGGLAFRGNKMYAIKTAQDDSHSVISEYRSARGEKVADHDFQSIMRHGNGLTYYKDVLYVAPCASYAVAVSTKDWSYKKLKSDVPVSGIAHYTGSKFFVTRKFEPGKTNRITIVRRDGDRLLKESSWAFNNPMASRGYTRQQGIVYRPSKKRLYIVFTHMPAMHDNIVLRYKVGAADPDWCFTSNKMPDTTYYEFEGIGFNKDEEMIIGANLPGGDVVMVGNR